MTKKSKHLSKRRYFLLTNNQTQNNNNVSSISNNQGNNVAHNDNFPIADVPLVDLQNKSNAIIVSLEPNTVSHAVDLLLKCWNICLLLILKAI